MFQKLQTISKLGLFTPSAIRLSSYGPRKRYNPIDFRFLGVHIVPQLNPDQLIQEVRCLPLECIFFSLVRGETSLENKFEEG